MNTNLTLQSTDETKILEILEKFPLTQIYFECERGKIDTRNKKDISSIYLKEISKIIDSMIEYMHQNMSYEQAFQQAIFDDSRFEILEDYSQGFLNQQQLSDYLRDSYKDEDLSKGAILNDVYIR